ncbi:uncharacterized protein MKK02DRAFT_41986 [Dioszegia hungarica]|uniref:Cytochrome c oxidase assembly protein COX20, mitochondrial n=1 Tax=Dioszegia hungarica TaxID=4972 RepID=A0AA38LYG0_9TREE|nr:uncharacterized protein MKK02DRAFT_41986 [Dioszegia hungarica]KAI9638956.1 hypothetical protein MKK02DRAFT_41986 [Dioszegia hungarica]
MPTLNIPTGNSTISEPVSDEQLSGDRVTDIKKALETIDLKNDFRNIEQIPCIRQSLLSGIAGGAGIGAVRYLASRSPRAGANWAVASFVIVSIFQCASETARRHEKDTGALPTHI